MLGQSRPLGDRSPILHGRYGTFSLRAKNVTEKGYLLFKNFSLYGNFGNWVFCFEEDRN